jgi:tetratricopeptide (TPR) repeat protein
MGIMNDRLAIRLDPQSARARNDLAWALASVPSDPWFDPKEALNLAREAVRLDPTNWYYANTLGVAAFRSREWKTAGDALQQSIHFNGGAAIDCFFLAMTRWQQGDRNDAQRWFDQAVAWIERNKAQIERNPSEQAQLRQFQAEATALLRQSGPVTPVKSSHKGKPKKKTETAHEADPDPDQHSAGTKPDQDVFAKPAPDSGDGPEAAVLTPGNCGLARGHDPLRLFQRG